MKRFGLALACFLMWQTAAGATEPLRPSAEQINQSGLQSVFDQAAKEKRAVILPAGTFSFEEGPELDGIDVSGQGSTTVLQGTKVDRNALVVTGHGARLADLAVHFESGKRSGADGSALVLVTEARDFVVEGLFLSGGDSAGLFVRESSAGKILRNRIENTLADGIHITARSHDILIDGNILRGTGDDGIAVVSYRKNEGLSRRIDIMRNLVSDNVDGRGISVVGGEQVRISGNAIHCKAPYAGILIASESAFQTFGASGIAVTGNRVEACGNAKTGHGSITVSRDNADLDGLWIESNYITNAPAAALVVEGRGVHGVLVKDNGFSGFGEGPIVFRQPQNEVILSGNSSRAPEWVAAKTKGEGRP